VDGLVFDLVDVLEDHMDLGFDIEELLLFLVSLVPVILPLSFLNLSPLLFLCGDDSLRDLKRN